MNDRRIAKYGVAARYGVAVMAAVTLLSTSDATAEDAADLKIGGVDVQAVLDRSTKGRGDRTDIQSEVKRVAAELRQRQRAIESAEDELDNFSEGEPAYIRQKAHVDGLKKALDTFRRESRTTLVKNQSANSKQLGDQMRAAAKRLAAEHGYDAIVQVYEGKVTREVLYRRRGVAAEAAIEATDYTDVTADILEALDAL